MVTTSPEAIPSIEAIAGRLAPFDCHLSDAQLQDLRKYLELLIQWNEKISLTSLEDPLEIVSRHFGESLFARNSLSFGTGRLADVGSGAGFPGVPIKIANPDLDVVLIEPNLKKCGFLKELIGRLSLENVEIFRGGYAEYQANGDLDFICSRALGQYKELLRWSQTALRPLGQVAFWVGEQDSRILCKTNGWHWRVPTRLPESSKRLILFGSPYRAA